MTIIICGPVNRQTNYYKIVQVNGHKYVIMLIVE